MITHTGFVNLFNKDNTIFDKLLKDTTTLSKLSNRIVKISKDFEKLAYKDANKVKGDLFEIFAECFFKILAADNRIGVYDYKPAPPIDDYGVDGIGEGMDEKPLTVQVKFRANDTTELTQDDIKQFGLQSIVNYEVDKDTKTNMIVFTNARGLHWITETKVFSSRIRCLGYEQISTLVDNNTVFWRKVNDLINQTINHKYGK